MTGIQTAYLNALGVVCPMGDSARDVARRLFSGHGGVVPTDAYTPGRETPVGMIIATLPDVAEWPAPLQSRNNRVALAAARQIEDAIRGASARYGAHRVAVVLGTSTSGIAESENALAVLGRTGSLPPAFHFGQQELASPAQFVAAAFGLRGPAVAHSTACASSAKAMASAARLLRMGVVDAVVTGGVDTLCAFTVAGFSSLELVSSARCNPLSANRDGVNIGEAGALFLMSREPATVSLRGWGESSDGHHFSAPDPAGRGARVAVDLALRCAGEPATSVEYVNLHGTATRQNDAMESAVVHAVFGGDVPVSSTKPLTGHTLGAAGAIEAAFCWLSMQDDNARGALPPHLWDGVADAALPRLRTVLPGESLGRPPRRALSNSFAFGGANASLLFGRD